MSQLPLKAQIMEDTKAAMRAKEMDRLDTVRLLQTAIKQREVDECIGLDDAVVLAVIDKMPKQRKDPITAFEQAGCDGLVAKEAVEVTVLQVYMPVQLSEAEVDVAVCGAVAKADAAGLQDMGKMMGILKPALVGRADMMQVSVRVKAALTGA